MRDFIQLTRFHVKLFAQNSYFVTLVLTSTLSALMIQYLVAYAGHNLGDTSVWLRAGIIGLWASGTSAAGILMFQKFQGTLAYLLDNVKGDLVALMTLIIPAATFGLLAFPLAGLAAFILGFSVKMQMMTLLGVILFWLAVVVLDLAIAGGFVLLKSGMVYESLLLVPIMVFGGVFDLPKRLAFLDNITPWLLPVKTATRVIYTGELSALMIGQYLFSSLIWLVLAGWSFKVIMVKIRQTGSLELL